MKKTLLATVLGLTTVFATAPAFADAQKFVLDPSHSQIVFDYNHLGFSTGTGMFSGFNGVIMFDQENPAASSVQVSLPVTSIITGWQARTDHFMSADFFGAADKDAAANAVTFVSTSIKVTGKDTALITGDLTLNGITKPVVLDSKLNQIGMHPMAGVEWAGFSATTTVLRSDFGLGLFAPYVSDEVEVKISIEAAKDALPS